MIFRQTMLTFAITFAILLTVGCGQRMAPDCNDNQTKQLALEIVEQNWIWPKEFSKDYDVSRRYTDGKLIGEATRKIRDGSDPNKCELELTLSYVRPEKIDKDIGKHTCAAQVTSTLRTYGDSTVKEFIQVADIAYTSEFADGKAHMSSASLTKPWVNKSLKEEIIAKPQTQPKAEPKAERNRAQTTTVPQKLSLPTDWFFAGSINSNSSNDIKIYVRFKQQGTSLSGILYYKKYNVDMPINGTVDNENLVFYEIDPKGNQTGLFKGQLTHDKTTGYSIKGSWSKPNGDKMMPFLLSYGGSHPLETLEDKYITAAVKKTVGSSFETLRTNLAVASNPELDSEGNMSLHGCRAHACGISEAEVYLEKNGSVSVAILDGDKISHFTNNSSYKGKMAAPLKKFAGDFPMARIIDGK